MKRIATALLAIFFVPTLLCGCQKSGAAAQDPLPKTLGDHITLSDTVQVPEVGNLAVYTAPFTMLDAEAFVGTVIADEDLTIKDLSEEGVMMLSNQVDYLTITVRDFMFYRNFFLRQKGPGYDEYDDLLSAMALQYPDHRGGLRYYAYAPDTYLADAADLGAITAQGKDLAAALGMSLADRPFRAEYLDGSVFADLGLDPADYSVAPFYRLFWNFQKDGIPVLGPEFPLIRSGNPAGGAVVQPYMEMLIDEDGVQHAMGMSCLTDLAENGDPVDPLPVQEALDAFQNHFAGQDLTEETRIEIQELAPAYVAVQTGQVLSLEPAWVIAYEQAGARQCMAVRMSTGELL